MINLWLLIFLLGCNIRLFSQNIIYAEYFIDDDPGVGSGTPIPVLVQADSVVLNYTVPIAGLPEGMHTLFVRTRDDSARWSHYEGRTFYITDMTAASNKQLVAAEYFFDSDPGAGNAMPVSINSPSQSVVQLFTASTSGLSEGMHTACFRTKDNQGAWSLYEQRTFYLTDVAPASAKEVVAAEYFIDSDPGVGNGSALPFSHPSDSARLSFTLNPVYSLGSSHYLFVRTKDSQGKWSHYEGRRFEICSNYGAHSDFRFDINGNSVLFHNLSEHDTSHQWIFGDGNSSTTLFNPNHVFPAAGIYSACLVTSNICAIDTLCKNIVINGVTSITPSYHSNTGLAVTIVRGFGFTPNSVVSLSDSVYAPIVADTTIFLDSLTLKAIFAFSNAPLAAWDVVVTTNGQSDTLKDGFTTQPPTGIGSVYLSDCLSVEIIGPDQILLGRHTPVRMKVINKCNSTIYAVPVFIFVDRNNGNHNFGLLAPLDNTGANDDMLDSVPPFIPGHNPETGGPDDGGGNGDGAGSTDLDPSGGGPGNTGGFIIPVIPPGGSGSIPFAIQPLNTNCIDVKGTVGEPLMGGDDFHGGASCHFLPACVNCALGAGGFVPVLGCLTGAFQLGCSIGNIINGDGSTSSLIFDFIGSLGGTVIDCAGGKNISEGLKFAAETVDLFGDAYGAYVPCDACVNPNPPAAEKRICAVAGGDPNGKYGPSGYSSYNFISDDAPLNYTIFFENIDTATAPASEVVITDVLDTTVFDLNSFEFTGFGFGDTVFTLNEKSESFARDIDLRSDKNIILRISGFLNKEDGKLEIRFASFDPATMNITDSIFKGFLPPNVSPPEGQGHFSFSISPRENLLHGTVFENAADIVFDYNPAIQTPNWINIIDREKPESAINPLQATIYDSVLTITWTGFDAHAGVMDYDIYVSVDDSTFVRLFSSDDTIAIIDVDSGHTYKFYSIARDRVGNMEDAPTVPDATTSTIVVPSITPNEKSMAGLKVFPNPSDDKLNIEFTLPEDSRVRLEILSLTGQRLATLFEGDVIAGVSNTVEYQPVINCGCMVIYRLQTEQGSYYGKAVMVR